MARKRIGRQKSEAELFLEIDESQCRRMRREAEESSDRDDLEKLYVKMNDRLVEVEEIIERSKLPRPAWVDDFEAFVDEVEKDLYGEHGDPRGAQQTEWADFLKGHPELTPEQAPATSCFVLPADWEVCWERSRRRKAEAELLRMRRAWFPFSDDDVLGALRKCGSDKASATDVTRVLYGSDTVEHHARIRAGHALGRLARAGRVRIAAEPGRSTSTRWAVAPDV